MASDDVQAAIPNQLPGESFLLDRMGASTDKRVSLRPVFATIAVLTLDSLSNQTEIPFPSAMFQAERVYYSGKVPYLVPQAWPVKQIVSAFAGASTQQLKIGSEQELARGNVQIAIAQPTGDRVRCNLGRCSTEVFMTYRAGMDKLPPDLLEVFAELAFLMWKEDGRIGTTSDKFKDAEVRFTRKLPDWAKKTLGAYRRIASFV